MQNKANLLDTQMNVSSVTTKEYENKRLFRCPENKPNQTQPVVSLSNLLQTNHPIFKISLKNPCFLDFLSFFHPFFISPYALEFIRQFFGRVYPPKAESSIACPA